MKINSTQLAGIALAAGMTLTGGCQTARMAVPPQLDQGADVLPCAGRQGFKLSENFSFGDYRVEKVKRGWTRRFMWSAIAYESVSARHTFEFDLLTPAGVLWHGQAATGVKKGDLKGMVAGGELTIGLTHNMNFVVNLAPGDATNAWTLAMSEGSRAMLMKGAYSGGRQKFSIEASRQLAGTHIPLMDNAGFIVYDGKTPVAAVELINAGTVRFARELPPDRRDALAAAAAALLLYRDISGSD